jgi:hypothetical protein
MTRLQAFFLLTDVAPDDAPARAGVTRPARLAGDD